MKEVIRLTYFIFWVPQKWYTYIKHNFFKPKIILIYTDFFVNQTQYAYLFWLNSLRKKKMYIILIFNNLTFDI